MVLWPISAVHSAVLAWRQTRATGSLAPGHGQGASWPSGELAPSGRGCHKLPPDVNAGWPGTREFGRAAKSAGSSGARRHPGRNVRMKIGKQSQPGMHYASTWLSGFISLSHLQAHPRLLRVCAHMRRCVWHVENLLWKPPCSDFHKMWMRLRRSRPTLISKFGETWSVQGVPLGMYAPAFLSLNKKQAKSHDILKAKRLGSID